jgi:hypothetical protein
VVVASRLVKFGTLQLRYVNYTWKVGCKYDNYVNYASASSIREDFNC